MKTRKKYPGTEYEPDKKPCLDNEPDILQTASGFCPNYEKFEKKGMSVEEALIFCNMD